MVKAASAMIPALFRSAAARVFLSAILLVLFIGIGFVNSADTPRVQPAKIARLTGTVTLLAPGSTQWRAVNLRERIMPGTKIRTGKNSSVLLQLSKNNLVSVGENAEFALNEALVRRVSDPSMPIFFLSPQRSVYDYEVEQTQGRATALLKGLGKGSNFSHRTPVSVAGVRGTIYVCHVRISPSGLPLPAAKGDGDGTTTQWSVYDGSLFVQGATPGSPGFTLGDGQSFTSGGEGGDDGPTDLSDEEMQDLNDEVQQEESEEAFDESSVPGDNSLYDEDFGDECEGEMKPR